LSDAYIERRENVYVVAGTRMSLDSVVYALRSGQSAEAITQAFPVLNLEQVCGAITCYLGHRDDIDRYLESRRQDFAGGRATTSSRRGTACIVSLTCGQDRALSGVLLDCQQANRRER